MTPRTGPDLMKAAVAHDSAPVSVSPAEWISAGSKLSIGLKLPRGLPRTWQAPRTRGRVWSRIVVVVAPFFKALSIFGQRVESLRVEAFVAHLAIGTRDQAILGWLARRNEVQVNAVIACPAVEVDRSELAAVVHAQ